MASKSAFEGHIEFCPECGSILPLPGKSSVVACYTCDYAIDIKEFHGIEIKSEVIFNKVEDLARSAGLTSDDFSGPTVDHRCAKCGNEEMTYTTRQTRSADEGQTVFYNCPKCGYQEQEYS